MMEMELGNCSTFCSRLLHPRIHSHVRLCNPLDLGINMLASRARILPRLSPLARQATAARRFMADQPNLSPSSSPSTSLPGQSNPASAAPVAAPTTQPRPVASPQGIVTPQQRASPKLQDGYSGVFYLSLLGGLVVTAPIITYFYWEHRKTHMRQKKEAILSDIHARVGTPK